MAETGSTPGSAYLLPLCIILASFIVSGSILFAFDRTAQSPVTGLVVNAQPSQALAPVPSNPLPAPSQPPQNLPLPSAVLMADTMKDAAAVRGDPNAPVVVVEYSDYQCPFCKRFFDDSYKSLKSQYVDAGKVLFVYKDFPLGFHPVAEPAALAARCSGEQGKYWEMHDKIFQEQGSLSETALKNWATELGLDTSQFNSCLDSKKFASVVKSNARDGTLAGVSGTPSFVIGKRNGSGQLVVGAQPFSAFESAIEALLQ